MTADLIAPPVRGRVRATGFLLEPAVLGEAEARRRVLAAWRPGARLLLLGDGGWLLLLAQPVDLRAEQAPGLPVLAGPGRPQVWRHGTAVEPDVDALPTVDVSGWLDLAALPVHELRQVQQPEPDPVPPEPEPDRLTGLRDVVGAPADESAAMRAGLIRSRTSTGATFSGDVGRWWTWSFRLVVATLAVTLVVLLVRSGSWPTASPRPSVTPTVPVPTPTSTPTSAGPVLPGDGLPPGTTVPPGLLPGQGTRPATGGGTGLPGVPVLLVIALIALRRLLPARAGRAGTATGGPTRAGTGRSNLLRRKGFKDRFGALLVSPFGVLLRRRHERYLLGLTRAFQRGDLDTALRRAIAIGGTTGGTSLSVRLPRPRLGALTPSAQAAGQTTGMLGPLQVWAYLRELYTQAAEQLERDGRIEQAAFVRADLLHAPQDAVAVLERHGRTLLAAELALGRALEPALAVRLFWQAGQRDRAVDVARLRGGLEEAARRLDQSDPALAQQLRAEWVAGLLRAGDLVAAVRAGWRYPPLRPLLVPHLAAGVAAGGPDGALLLAHLVSSAPTPDGLAAAEALLGSRDDDLRPARASFVTALADLEPEHPAADRRMASAAVRLLVAEPGLLSDRPRETGRRVTQAMRGRAGALLAADAPTLVVAAAPRPDGAWQVTAAAGPGRHLVLDAVALPAGVLVALGGAGIRLLTADGRVRARWEQTAHRLVVADHGTSVLLVAGGERTRDLQRLDLATRQVRPWTVLPRGFVPGCFDGAVLPVLDAEGLAFLDTTGLPGARPRTVWRELEPGVRVLALERGAGAMSAWVQGSPVNTDLVPELWTWALPGLQLRTRVRRELGDDAPVEAVALSAGCGLLSLHTPASRRAGEPAPVVVRWHPADHGLGWSIDGADLAGVAASGPHLAVVRRGDEGLTLEVLADPSGRVRRGEPPALSRPILRAGFPAAEEVALRHHGDVVTVHDGTGRVVAVDVGTGRVVANLVLQE